MNKLRWGILSAANIARKNWKAIQRSCEAVVVAVASRDPGRSRQFIHECQADAPFETAPLALGSYEELIARRDIDAVYIPLPTGLRKEWVLRAVAAGKHVLCEKPCGLNAADVRQMIDACRSHHVQFMDGVMFMHNPRLDRIRKALDDPAAVGAIKRIMSGFSFFMDENSARDNVRLDSRLEPAGSLGDLGWYCVRFALWAMRWELPRQVSGRILAQGSSRQSPSPVPIDFSAELIFDQGASVGFYTSFQAEYQNWIHVGGSKGYLRMPDFVHALSDHEPSFELNRAEVRVRCCECGTEHTDDGALSQQTHMMRNFARQVRSGQLNDSWPMMALKTQQVVDACLDSARLGGITVSVRQA